MATIVNPTFPEHTMLGINDAPSERFRFPAARRTAITFIVWG
jgi:hypothetical protein